MDIDRIGKDGADASGVTKKKEILLPFLFTSVSSIQSRLDRLEFNASSNKYTRAGSSSSCSYASTDVWEVCVINGIGGTR